MKSTKPVTTEHHQPRTLNKTLHSVVAVVLGLMLADHAQAAATSAKSINISSVAFNFVD